MQGRSFLVRGNTMLAGVILISLLGAAAIALDNAGVVPSSQVAQSAGTNSVKVSPKTAAEQDAENQRITQKCVAGYDYLIHEVSERNEKGVVEKKWKTEPTLNGSTAAPKGSENQCSPLQTPPQMVVTNRQVVGDQISRTCDATWLCNVYYCDPDTVLTAERKKNNDRCRLTYTCRPDEDCKTQGARDYNLAFSLKDLALKGNLNETQKQALLQEGRDLAPEYRNAVLDAVYNEEKVAKTEVDTKDNELMSARNELRKIRDDCQIINDANKERCNGAIEGALRNVEVADKEHRDAIDRAQSLKNSRAILASTAPPGTSPPVDPPTGPPYQPPLSTFRDLEKLKEQCARATQQGLFSTACLQASGNPDAYGRIGADSNNPTNQGWFGSGFGNIGSWMGLIQGALGFASSYFNQPSCTLTASPTSITTPGTAVTLSWTTQNAAAAYLSNAGQVGPQGSMQVNPQQTTTYQMQVMGRTQQQQPYNPYNPYGSQVQQDSYCVSNINPTTVLPYPATQGCYNYRTTTGSTNYGSPYAQLGQQLGQLAAGGSSQAQCQVQVTVNPQTTGTPGAPTPAPGSEKPSAQISCQPLLADVGMQVAISYACQNAATSAGDGFSTNNAMSGSATAKVESPNLGASTAVYGITCSNQGQTDSKQCTVQVNRTSIVLVASPKKIKSGESVNIGWVSGGMESCTISSPALTEFTSTNANTTNPSGVAKTPSLTQNTKFILSCTTKAGGTKTAETTVEIAN